MPESRLREIMVGEELKTFWVPVVRGQGRKCREKQEVGARMEGELAKDLGLSQRPNKLTAQHTTNCIYKEQSDISSICTQRAEPMSMLVGKGL